MRRWVVAAAAALFLCAGTGASLAQDLKPEGRTSEQIKALTWKKSPNGTEQATVLGDPTKPGIYVVLSKFPPGTRTPVHFHPDDRVVTVLSGTAYFAYSEAYDDSKLTPMPAGSVYTEPAKTPHYNWSKDGELVLQIVGHGPSGTTPFKSAQDIAK